MPGAVISTPNLLFYFPGESIASLTGRWTDWVARDATVITRKDQSQDAPGVFFELLRTHLLMRPALTAAVAIAEPRLDWTQSAGTKLIFYGSAVAVAQRDRRALRRRRSRHPVADATRADGRGLLMPCAPG